MSQLTRPRINDGRPPAKRNRPIVIISTASLVLGINLWFARTRLWFPVRSASITLDGAVWQNAEVVRSPSDEDERYYVFKRSGSDGDGYLIDLRRGEVILPPMSFYCFCGVVLPKDPQFVGVLMDPAEEKAPHDPELVVAPDQRSFSFRDEKRRLLSVKGL